MGSLFRRLFAASALCLLANAMVTALLPPFIRDELGGDAAACPGQCAVLRRGIAGGLSWGAQGVVLAFLILHLREEGVVAPAAVLTIFAVSVILARLVLASSMTAAAAGAILLGIGFATLQPSLTLLALDRLDPRRRQAGTGLFVACMDLGVAAGTALGGLVADWRGEEAALMLAAGFTLAGAGVIADGSAVGRRRVVGRHDAMPGGDP